MIYWFIAVIFFSVIELIVPGLISIWFAIAATGTIFYSLIEKNVLYQGYFFIILSAILIMLTRRISKRILKYKNSNIDRITGSVVEIKNIDLNKNYEIYFDGKHWLGKSKEELEVGDRAKILKIEGIKLILEKYKGELEI